MKYGFHKIGLSMMAFLACLSLAACSPVVHEGGSSASRESQSLSREESRHYPVTVTSMNSKGEMEEEAFDKPPERVVAVWQNSIETLLALGVGNRIVAGMGIPNEKYLRPEYRDQYEKIPYTSLQNLDMEPLP